MLHAGVAPEIIASATGASDLPPRLNNSVSLNACQTRRRQSADIGGKWALPLGSRRVARAIPATFYSRRGAQDIESGPIPLRYRDVTIWLHGFLGAFSAGNIFIRYKVAEAGEIDNRPTETLPEDTIRCDL